VDGAGNPYVAGTIAGTNFLGTPVSASGSSEAAVSRLDPATGRPVWVSVAVPGLLGAGGVMGLGIDNQANLYVIGELFESATFPTQPAPTTVSGDSFIAKYDQNGQCLWAKQIGGGTPYCFGAHLAVNGAGQIYLTGEFDGTVTFGSTTLTDNKPGSGNADSVLSGFLAKLDADGQTWLWARGFSAEGERVTLDASGNPSLTGAFFDQALFGAENPPTSQTLASLGDEDQYLAKYDAAGNFQFAKALPGDGESSENIIESANVNVKLIPIRLLYNPATCRLHVSGDFSGTLMLDSITLNSGANRHGFVAELESLFALSPRIRAFPATGGSSSLKVSAGCNSTWTAVSNNPDVVNPTSLPGGTGDGMVSYQVLANSAASRRAGTMMVAGQTFTVLQGANFQDVAQDHPFYSFIGKFSAYGLTSGCGSGNYCPDRTLRRDELAILLIRALGETPSNTRYFTDVPPGSFGFGQINRMFELHITAGCGGGNYCPAGSLTRGQVAVFLVKAFGL